MQPLVIDWAGKGRGMLKLYAQRTPSVGQSRKRIANREERESHFLEALDDVYRSEGFDGLSTKRLNELKLYFPLYHLGWNQQKICHRYGMTTEEWKLRKKKISNQSKGHIDWNENKIYEIWDILVQHYGYVPTANEVRQEFPKYQSLFGAMTELRISIDQVRAMYPSQKYGPNFNLITTTIDGQPIKGFKNHTRWTESVNGMRWHSRAEASVSNFLYGRGIHHKKGELYGEEYSRDSDYSRGWYDIHFEAQDGRYIDLEIWGNMDENYARKRRAKEKYNSNNPNFLGIDFDDCTEFGLTKAFEPYIGIIEPYIFDKPEHRVIQTSFWTDAEEVIETCRWLAGQQSDGIFPPESWLRKRGKYKNRSGETYNTLGIYIEKYVGGMINLRRILEEPNQRHLKWNRDSVLAALDEWMEEYCISPNAYYQRKVKEGKEDEISKYARSIHRGVIKHLGTTYEAMKILGYSQENRGAKWKK